MKILVTGCAGFIGFHLCLKLALSSKYTIYGIDNLNNYYDIKLKKERINNLKKNTNFFFNKIDICNENNIKKNFLKHRYQIIIHLAAQAGVRHSIKKPKDYVNSNLIGFFNILENSKNINAQHFIFASTSSVYGKSDNFPLKENFNTDKPQSFYAATKKCNEVLAYSYCNIYNIPCTGLRFFTVYGPYGRPDMALFNFTKNIISKKNITLFNHGNHTRDFTFIDDVVLAIKRLINKPSKAKIPFQIFNIASNRPRSLLNFLQIIEKNLNITAKIKYANLQKGDVIKTHASINKINKIIDYNPKISLEKGINIFVKWYIKYYKK